ncbi:uncharacterized protein LDX57_005046 [Aspergillus melleus]|uniref:uncharacterized protein n=1 Tax=Aspergillus melleus TaxID=138277 RepID=UPI001E8E0335|nr:uncharacterized protein LDX57_005046 [Aspergillus melleus]KAH8427332.1 hypothetical protein LDX57_005046 [Aspergillus melleus]
MLRAHLLTGILLCSVASVQSAHAVFKKRLTCEDCDSGRRWGVTATDLGIPYVQDDGEIGFLFGDTLSSKRVEDAKDWRCPVMLRSRIHPGEEDGLEFQGAAGVDADADGLAQQITHNGNRGDDGTNSGIWEYSVLPNDGISFPETGEHFISYMSVMNWTAPWTPNYSGLAVSTDGNTFERLDNSKWWNNEDNTDPFQMWTMQRDDQWVYIFSTRSPVQFGPMLLQRVRWDLIKDKDEYECWGLDGNGWDWGDHCSPILEGTFGEPSVRKLEDGTWAMVYLNAPSTNPWIVSRTAKRPTGPWSEEKVQVEQVGDGSLLYGGFIHPWSTTQPNGLYLMVSNWTSTAPPPQGNGAVATYEGIASVNQYIGTL